MHAAPGEICLVIGIEVDACYEHDRRRNQARPPRLHAVLGRRHRIRTEKPTVYCRCPAKPVEKFFEKDVNQLFCPALKPVRTEIVRITFSSHLRESIHMNKLIAALVAGLFASVAFAQEPAAAPAAPAAKTEAKAPKAHAKKHKASKKKAKAKAEAPAAAPEAK